MSTGFSSYLSNTWCTSSYSIQEKLIRQVNIYHHVAANLSQQQMQPQFEAAISERKWKCDPPCFQDIAWGLGCATVNNVQMFSQSVSVSLCGLLLVKHGCWSMGIWREKKHTRLILFAWLNIPQWIMWRQDIRQVWLSSDFNIRSLTAAAAASSPPAPESLFLSWVNWLKTQRSHREWHPLE